MGFLFLFLFFLIPVSGFAYGNDPVFSASFDFYDSTKPHFGDTISYKLRADTFGLCADFRSTDSTKSVRIQSDSIPLDSIRGWRILLSAWTKADSLTTLLHSWNGVKVMLVIRTPDGLYTYPQLSWPASSSWPWQKVWRIVTVPHNAVSMYLSLGLESVAGHTRIDSVSITRLAHAYVPPRDSTIPIPSSASVRLRGAMIGTAADSESVAQFGSVWKGNLFRWQLGGTFYPNALARPDYDSLLLQETKKLDKLLPVCRQNNIKVLVDLHSLSTGLFISETTQIRLMDTWRKLANHYRDSVAVFGYDLANEPCENLWHPGVLFLDDLSDSLCRIIRSIDPVKPIVVEPSLNTTWFADFKPIGWNRGYDLKDIIYSVHCYSPFQLTHQGIGADYPPFGAVYPGTIDNIVWDSILLRQAVQPAVNFQKRYRVPIYIGEFSCVRWANNHSAIRWLTDFISIMESYGWDWTYHAYKEYHGWSVEFSDSLGDMRTPLETDRKALLLSYFALNQNPYDSQLTDVQLLKPGETDLLQCHPNPMNPSALISCKLPEKGAMLAVYSMDGRKIRSWDLTGKKGLQHVMWDTSDDRGNAVASGVYLLLLRSDEQMVRRRIVLAR